MQLSLSNSPLLQVQAVASYGFSKRSKLFVYGSRLIYACGNNIIIDDCGTKVQLKGHDNKITAMGFSPQRQWLISGQLASPGNKNYDSPVLIFDLKTARPIHNLNGLKQGVKTICVSEDEDLIGGVSYKHVLMLWNTKNMQQIYTFSHEFNLNLLVLRSTHLLCLVGKGLQHFDLANVFLSNKPPEISNYTLPSTGLARNFMSLCELGVNQYLIGTEGGEICYFEKGIFKFLDPLGKANVESITCTPDKSCIMAAIGNQIIKCSFKGNKITIQTKIDVLSPFSIIYNPQTSSFNVLSLHEIRQMDLDLKSKILQVSHSSRVMEAHSSNSLVASIQQDGQTMISMAGKNELKCIGSYLPVKPTEGRCVHIIEGAILNGYSDGYIRCINQNGSQLLWEILAHKNGVTSLFSTNSYFLSGGEDSVVRVWASKTNKAITQVSAHQKPVSRVLADCQQASLIHSCSQDKSVYSYNLKTDKKIAFRQGNNGSILDMTQRSDNGDLITCGFGMPIYIWGCQSNNPTGIIEANEKVCCVSMSPGNSRVAAGSELGFIYLINLQGNKILGKIEAHSREVTTLVWLNESCLVSGCDGNSLALWTLP